ncbi:hypothetical protein ABSL23_01215 (plasmid) [Halobacterium sp. NMX12-1]|uniref:Uncharacterized protein n=1 Tax=Halobacterium sp. NMX12-1 TaxID=3166650 RepID=A0AAU8C906_9EURY
MSTELVVERDKIESLLPLLGAKANADGYIVDSESEEVISGPDGEKLTIDEMGYIGHGSIEPVEDDFSAIVSYLSEDDPRQES